MTRDRKEVDDILFALDRAYLLLSNKNLPDENKNSWLKALHNYGTNEILDAIDAHIAGDSGSQSRYAPKPRDIIDLISNVRGRQKSFTKPKEDKPCDPRIAKAWMIAMRLFYGFEAKAEGVENIQMTNDEALEIVNQQARLYKRIDAIPEQFRV